MSEPAERLSSALSDKYRVERELGAGGMATVWLGEDLRHQRKVAIKVLRPELAAVIGAERFLQEIRVTANLQHPHILPLHDSGEADGLLYYVMPYVEGESLRDRLTRERQLGLDEALSIAREAASALDYAHRHGVVHRDIKPENILLHDGQALVADFGIALAVSSAGSRMTETGLSLGTPHYMSPEQATGDRTIDARSDVYSLGAVLYEMLAGEPPYTGPSAQAIIARVITEKAPLVSLHRDTVPPHVEGAIARSLAKLPADRFHSTAEFAEALTRPITGTPVSRRTTGGWVHDPRTISLVVVALAAIGLQAWNGAIGREAEAPPTRVTLNLPPGTRVEDPPAISPDGRTLAYLAHTGGVTRINVRRLDTFETIVLEGAEGARGPFFSPDGSTLGFVREERVFAIGTGGGAVREIGRTTQWLIGGVFARDSTILVTSVSGPLFVLTPGSGREPGMIAPDTAAGEFGFSVPVLLPDGRFLVGVGTVAGPRLALLSRDGRAWSTRRSDIVGAPVAFIPPDLLVITDAIANPGSTRQVVRIDLDRLALRSAAVRSPDSASVLGGAGLSENGSAVLLHYPRGVKRRAVWVSRDGGQIAALDLEEGHYRWPRLSPDGTRLAIGSFFGHRGFRLISTDLRTGRILPLTDGGNTEPTWNRDGRRLAYSSGGLGTGYQAVGWQPADGSGVSSLLAAADFELWPTDWSPDGRFLAVYGSGGARQSDDLYWVDLQGRLDTLVSEPGAQKGGRFSPDGRWLAYQSRAGGQWEVLVRPYPSLDRKWVVSLRGGAEPIWAPDGRELFYRQGDAIMAVTARGLGAEFIAETPRVLFRGPFWIDFAGDQSYDLHPDGRRFLMLEDRSEPQIQLVLNWATEVKALSRASQR